MQYWDEFVNKFGFGDGDAAPPDVAERRDVYIRYLNALAESLGSNVRAMAFDRGGCHNFHMIVLVQAGTTEGVAVIDEAWEEAFDKAMEAGLDEYVETTVTIKEAELAVAIQRAIRKAIRGA
jgi:hypothetical protein